MKKIILFSLIFLLFNSCAEKVSKNLDIRLIPPKNWVEINSDKELFRNLYKDSADFKLKESKEIYRNFIARGYLKYDDNNHLGINPVIQIQTHNNPDKYFNDFFQTVTNKIEWYKKNVDGFELLKEPEKRVVDKTNVVYFRVSHKQLIDDSKVKVRSEVFMIPNGNELHQITLNDSDEDDCSKEFIEVINSIKLR